MVVIVKRHVTAFQGGTAMVADKSKMSPMYWLRKVTVEPVLFLYMFSLYLLFGVFQGHYSIENKFSLSFTFLD